MPGIRQPAMAKQLRPSSRRAGVSAASTSCLDPNAKTSQTVSDMQLKSGMHARMDSNARISAPYLF
jgi:hypothetical protein